MQPSLYAVKKQKGQTTGTRKTLVRLVVIDHEKGKKYPQNFVCVLPGQLGFPTSTFDKLYGTRAEEMAKTLLTDALKRETDSAIRREIRRRLEAFQRSRNPSGTSQREEEPSE
ncbi:MAG: hypothetical protein ACE14S_05730 [Candidatus Bathyarchaeia archaeon]